MDLATQTCIPCREGAPTLTKAELEALLPQLPGWSVVEQHHLQHSLLFPDFQSALDWVIAAGAICEGQGHHTEAVIYTQKMNGLTQADVVLAAKFNQIGSGPG